MFSLYFLESQYLFPSVIYSSVVRSQALQLYIETKRKKNIQDTKLTGTDYKCEEKLTDTIKFSAAHFSKYMTRHLQKQDYQATSTDIQAYTTMSADKNLHDICRYKLTLQNLLTYFKYITPCDP